MTTGNERSKPRHDLADVSQDDNGAWWWACTCDASAGRYATHQEAIDGLAEHLNETRPDADRMLRERWAFGVGHLVVRPPEDGDWQAAKAWARQQDEAPAAVVQRWMTYDLFLAVVGSNAYDFDEWYERKGFGDAWAALCQKVRETFAACTGNHFPVPSVDHDCPQCAGPLHLTTGPTACPVCAGNHPAVSAQ